MQNSLDQAQKLELVVPEMPRSAHQAPVASVPSVAKINEKTKIAMKNGHGK